MTHSSCPTAVVNAPVNVVWSLLTNPAGWGSFFYIRFIRVSPEGPAAVGQMIYAESGPSILHLRIEFQLLKIDPAEHVLELVGRLPFRLVVHESLSCVSLGPNHCRVSYSCNFSLPPGWRGAFMGFLLRRKFDTGPADSLGRLKRAAEGAHVGRPGSLARLSRTESGDP